jgi:hypothetical protein
MVLHEFEGAMTVLRVWHPVLQIALKEFHGTLSDQSRTDDEAPFRLVQLLDFTRYQAVDNMIAELCPFDFKSAQCGSTGTAVGCLKRFKEDCQDPTRAAQERFGGVLVAIQGAAATNTVITGGGFTPGSGGGLGGGGLLDRVFSPLRDI